MKNKACELTKREKETVKKIKGKLKKGEKISDTQIIAWTVGMFASVGKIKALIKYITSYENMEKKELE